MVVTILIVHLTIGGGKLVDNFFTQRYLSVVKYKQNNRSTEAVNMKTIEVSGAILVHDGEVLCAQRNEGKYDYVSYKYEFPGGKIEQGETPAEALHRELIEEMEVDIPVAAMRHFYTVEHEYPDFAITMHCFICNMADRHIILKEHINAVWKSPQKLNELDWAAADRPVVEALVNQGEI